MTYFVVAVCGYLLACLVQAAGRRLSRANSLGRRRFGLGLRIAAGLITTITTTSWLVPAAFSGGVVGGVFMFVLLFVFTPLVVTVIGQGLGRLRARRGAGPIWPAVLIGGFALACLLPGAAVLAEAVMHLTGLAQPVDLLVTDITHSWVSRHGTALDRVHGTYLVDGVPHELSGRWMSVNSLPAEGATIPVTLSRLWPPIMIEDDSAAWVLFTIGAIGVVAGTGLMAMALRERKLTTAGPLGR